MLVQNGLYTDSPPPPPSPAASMQNQSPITHFVKTLPLPFFSLAISKSEIKFYNFLYGSNAFTCTIAPFSQYI